MYAIFKKAFSDLTTWFLMICISLNKKKIVYPTVFLTFNLYIFKQEKDSLSYSILNL